MNTKRQRERESFRPDFSFLKQTDLTKKMKKPPTSDETATALKFKVDVWLEKRGKSTFEV
jgi:hypothetical protein